MVGHCTATLLGVSLASAVDLIMNLDLKEVQMIMAVPRDVLDFVCWVEVVLLLGAHAKVGSGKACG